MSTCAILRKPLPTCTFYFLIREENKHLFLCTLRIHFKIQSHLGYCVLLPAKTSELAKLISAEDSDHVKILSSP